MNQPDGPAAPLPVRPAQMLVGTPPQGVAPQGMPPQNMPPQSAPPVGPHPDSPWAQAATAWSNPGFVPPPAPGQQAPVEAREPRFSSQQIVAALLAAAGVAVTLIGVVLLFVMASREGILTPPVRVGGGALVAAGLAGSAVWVRPRVGGRIGSVALLSTASAAAFFDVVAVTRIYHWVPLTLGLVIAFVVAALAGLAAVAWEEKWLFMAVVAGVAGLAPFLTQGAVGTLVAFLLVLQIVGVAPEFVKGWDELSAVRTLPAVLAATHWVGVAHADVASGVAASLVASVALIATVLVSTTRRASNVAAYAFPLGWVPVWAFAITSDRTTWALVAAAMTLVAAASCYLLRHAAPDMRLAGFGVLGASGLTLAVATATGTWMALPFLALALASFVALAITREAMVGYAALALLVAGLLAQGWVAPYLDLFYGSRAAELPTSECVVGVLLLVVAAVAAWSVAGKALPAAQVQATLVVAGGAGLVGAAMTIIFVAAGTRTGFFLAHLVITVLAFILAAAVLLEGLGRSRHLAASMAWGLALVGCALVKLMAFDLHYMGAMTKALTFMVAGIVLLAAGTAYARTYAEAAKARPTGRQDAPAPQPQPQGW